MKFKLTSSYTPTGDQPKAIAQLSDEVLKDEKYQTLLGVTGSGKTFTMANVISEVERPTLILSHNKTLAGQLYGEFKQLFPENAVEYFISYYDYYQPEAYMPVSDVYIEKELSVNEEIERLRLSTIASLISGRRDVIVIASVSCIYGMGDPSEVKKNILNLEVGMMMEKSELLQTLVNMLYSRTETDFKNGQFRVKGDTIDIFPAYADFAYKIIFWADEIEEIKTINPTSGKTMDEQDKMTLFPGNMFVSDHTMQQKIIKEIERDLTRQIDYFEREGKDLEARRLEEKVGFDLEMIREIGFCSGIENYSKYLDGRDTSERPFCLLDYFPDDYLMFIDESHVTVPQIRGMSGGDRKRKSILVEHGFRLPSALDNRPLTFNEFESLTNQVIYVSATPTDYELRQCQGIIVEQIIRPTGLLDPYIEVKPTENQIDDLLSEIDIVLEREERTLITTITKRMSEDFSKYPRKCRLESMLFAL